MLCWEKTNITGENMGSTRKGMLNVLIAAVLWGSSGVCAQYIMEKSHISSPYLTMVRLLFTGVILLNAFLCSRRQDFLGHQKSKRCHQPADFLAGWRAHRAAHFPADD
jgi:drug/metabolite transporter (DMT)-like permease